MKLVKDGAFKADRFVTVPDNAALPGEGGAIVSLARFQKERDALIARNVALGVCLRPDQSPEILGPDLERLSVVVLEFAVFRDGRPFSWARMLRTRLGYKGEIRGAGNFLYDQINYMHRTGFNAFEVPDNFTIVEYEKALAEMTNVYQPSVDGRKTIRDLRAC